MTFRSKFDSRAAIVAVAALISGAVAGPAFAQLAGPPHAPYLARSVTQKAQAARPGISSMAANRANSSTQSDIASEPFPAVRSGRAPARAPVLTRAPYHGGPPR